MVRFPGNTSYTTRINGNLLYIYPKDNDNSLSSRGDDWSMRYVGKIVAQERVELSSLSGAVNPSRWSRYALDLSKYIGDDAAAVYQILITVSTVITTISTGGTRTTPAPRPTTTATASFPKTYSPPIWASSLSVIRTGPPSSLPQTSSTPPGAPG